MQSTPFAQYQTHAHTHVLVTHTIAPSWHMMMAAPWRAAPCSCCSLSCALLSSAYWVTRSAHAFAHLVSYVSRPHARMRACSRLHARTQPFPLFPLLLQGAAGHGSSSAPYSAVPVAYTERPGKRLGRAGNGVVPWLELWHFGRSAAKHGLR
jgi:hypothetical protein